jgi:hypothetical protein
MDNDLRGINFIKSAVDEVFTGCEYIDVVSVEEDGSHEYCVTLDIEMELTDEDFDVEVDEDHPKYSKTYFTGNAATKNAPLILLKHLVNNGKAHLDRFGYSYDSNNKRKNYIMWNLIHSMSRLHSIWFYSYDSYLFTTDDLELDYVPTIKTHYSPMRVRGVMDADPEEYEYEIEPTKPVKVRCYLVLYSIC